MNSAVLFILQSNRVFLHREIEKNTLNMDYFALFMLFRKNRQVYSTPRIRQS